MGTRINTLDDSAGKITNEDEGGDRTGGVGERGRTGRKKTKEREEEKESTARADITNNTLRTQASQVRCFRRLT